MREKDNSPDSSSLIDEFHVVANSSNCNKEMYLEGYFGVSITLKYEISCAAPSTCFPTPINALDDCGKVPAWKIYVQIQFI